MLSDTNTKLGPWIHSWSIPAAITCPGATMTCLNACYAMTRRFRSTKSAVFQSHLKNLHFTYDPDFVPYISAELRRKMVQVLRIHVAGDFFSTQYIQHWIEIAKSRPQTVFFAYTRSWREEDLLQQLIALGSLPNVQLWWSVDLSTGDPPMIPGIRAAYMAVNDEDAARTPFYCDLVFRDAPKSALKKGNGVQVCPKETGIKKLHAHINCSNCGICWQTGRNNMSDMLASMVSEELVAPPDFTLNPELVLLET